MPKKLPLSVESIFAEVLPGLFRKAQPRQFLSDHSREARRLKSPPEGLGSPPEGLPPAHRHPYYEICCLLRGACPFLLGDKRIRLRSGDVVVLAPDAFHREFAAESSGPYQLLWMNFNRGRMGIHLQDHVGEGRFNRQTPSAELKDFPEGLRIVEAVDGELWEQRVGSFLRVQGLLLELCGHVLRVLSDSKEPGGRKENPDSAQQRRVKRAVEYVRDHFTEPMDLGEVAIHVGVSPGYLSALFTQQAGRTFSEFLMACRLEEAERLLAEPALSVKEIAAKVGIENPFYFSRVFRKRTHLSPSQFRQNAIRRGT